MFVCVEPRGPASPIGVLDIDIQMTAVMRRDFGTAEPPSSEVELGRGRANGLVHVRAALEAVGVVHEHNFGNRNKGYTSIIIW